MMKTSFPSVLSAVALCLAQGLALAQQPPQNVPQRIRPTMPPGMQQPPQIQRPGSGLPGSSLVPQQNAQPGQQIRPGAVLPGASGPGRAPGRPAVAPPSVTAPPPQVLPPAAARPATTAAAPPSSGQNVISFTAAPLADVLEEYYRVTKRRVLKDRGLENATVSIEVPGEFSAEEYQSIIEKGLLMHGYAFVPSGPNLFKLVAAEQGTTPSTQGVPVILRSEELPDTDQVVSHVIQLNYIQAEEASSALQQLIPLHPYGKILAMDNARALVITEASQTIRAYIDLAREVDKPPMETMQKTFALQRATASEVVEQLSGLLGLSGGSGGGGVPGGAPRTGTVPRQAAGSQQGQPGMLPPGVPVAGAPAGGTSATLGGVSPEASKPILQAIERNNSIIAIARPTDMLRIESLIQELDAESTTRRYFSRRLNYLDLTVFLGIAEKALMRNSKNGGAGLTGSEPARTTTPTNTNSTFGNNNSSFGSGSSLGSGGFGGGLGGGGMSGSSGLGGGTPLEVTKKPMSVLIANTLVIADPASSKFFASGPPEQIQALEELADELDVRPRQILISAIIGELTLSDSFSFGLDWVKTLQGLGENETIGGTLVTQGAVFNPNTLTNIGTALAAGGPLGVAGFSAYGQINRGLGVFLNTLEGNQRFRVLQKPFLTTLNHQQAVIYIGQQVAIAGQTFTNGNNGNNGLGFTSTTQYIPVRLQLKITPHIFNESEVMLEFEQTNNGISGFTEISGNDVPNISEQGMSNSLIVANNTTAMLGGLITESNKNSKAGLPLLIRIPIIKHLFGSTSKDKDRKEMMIFVQPTILSDGPDHMLTQAKLGNYVQDFEENRAFGGTPDEGVPKALQVEDAVPVYSAPAPVYSAPTPIKEEETKKSFLGKMKSLFSRDKKR